MLCYDKRMDSDHNNNNTINNTGSSVVWSRDFDREAAADVDIFGHEAFLFGYNNNVPKNVPVRLEALTNFPTTFSF